MWHKKMQVVAAAAAGLVVALPAGQSVAVQSSPSAQVASQADVHRSSKSEVASARTRTAAGFAAVRATAGLGSSISSPGAGELWVAEQDEDGQLLIEHLSGGAWTQTTLPVSGEGARIFSGGGRVAVLAANQIRVLSGSGWVVQPSPVWEDGRATTLGQAAMGADGILYVHATATPKQTRELEGSVYRLAGGRWEALGQPHGVTWNLYGGLEQMKVVNGVPLIRWGDSYRSTGWETFERYDGQKWVEQFRVSTSAEAAFSVYGWAVRSVNDQLVFGQSGGFPGPGKPTCVQYTGGAMTTCQTAATDSKAAPRQDGSIALGGSDGFRVRRADGTEVAVAGKVGQGVVDLQTEPGTNRTWALTTSIIGGTRLQLLTETP